MDKNENVLHLTGAVSIDRELELDHDYKLEATAEVYTAGERRSNQDGTFNLHQKAKLLTCDILTDEGERIIGKVKGSRSQKLRGALYYLWQEVAPEMDFEKFYESFMDKSILHLKDIYLFLNKE